MIAVTEALRLVLLSNVALSTALSNGAGGHHIYGPQRTMPALKPPLPKAIVMQRAGGRVLAPRTRPRTFITCYGKDVQEAEALYRLLYPLFYNERGLLRGMRTVAGRWLLYWGQLSEPDTRIEPETGWPVASGILDSLWAAQELTA